MCPIPIRHENKKGDKAFETGKAEALAISGPNLHHEYAGLASIRQVVK